jgi:AAA domain/Protein of unknown function (DUF4011)
LSITSSSILQIFLRRLTNLGGTNRSLTLLRLSAEQMIDLQEFSFLKGEKSFTVLEALIASKSKAICQVLDTRMEANNKTSLKVKRLQRIDRFLFDERGSNDLHIGWPFVHGSFANGTRVRCPLLFFPVVLEQTGTDWRLRVREEEGIVFNKSFLLAYAFYNQVKPDEELIDFSFDEWDKDSTVFRTQLYQLLKDRIEINFNTDLFADEVKPFVNFTKATFEEETQQGILKLQPEAVLGIFPQAGSQLVPDYLAMIDSGRYTELETFFDDRNTHSTDTNLKEENLLAPLDLDAWQELAQQHVKRGKSFVVQGPPGTGKSQLIGNIICDAVANGKKILLVCQKRVALDVVYDRLSKLGLKNFVGLVHDYRHDRKNIYTTIASQIDSVNDFKNQNRSIDVIKIEREFYQISRRVDTIAEELEEFRAVLFQDTACGVSAKELYLTCNPTEPSINVKQEYSFFDFNELPEFISVVNLYVRYANRFEAEEYIWKHRVSFAHTNFSEVKKRTDAIDALDEFRNSFETLTKQIVGSPLSVAEGEALLASTLGINDMLRFLSSESIYSYFVSMLAEKNEETSLLWLDNIRLLCMNCFTAEGIESTLSNENLVLFQEILQRRMYARKRSFIRLLQWEFFSEDKFKLKRVLVANKLEYNRHDLKLLEKRLDNRMNLEHNCTALRKKSWLINLPRNLEQQTLLTWFDEQKIAIRAKLIFASLREIQGLINPARMGFNEFHNTFKALLKTIYDIPRQKNVWQESLSAYQIRQLLEQPELKASFASSLRNDFEDLAAFDTLKHGLSSNERAVIEKSFQFIGAWKPVEFEKIIQNSIRLEWLHHLETKYPILRLVSTQRFEDLETELKEAVIRKQQLSKNLLLIKVREQAVEHIAYNRLNNPTTYRDLEHQVTKKKKIWPLRKVINSFHHELFDLLPCWMASPESVSAIFPMKEIFDVVIFDEASQCFAERGLPAMMRGKQVVVAGDSQQLQPSDLYQIRWSEEEEFPDIEVESLLQLAERYLPTVYLQGHYRSQKPELIEFSNIHFYKGRLQMLPDYKQAISKIPAIDFFQVAGVWENQTNRTEAEAVVTHVMDSLLHYPLKEIGVIAFNAPQQQLIYDVLEEQFMARQQAWPATLFVKNIENVQGDEKDVIIFSIAYAPDKKGKMHLQFGSLSISGGENRLNVAITRAREKVIVITSILPEQLLVDEVKNEGPKLLRKYLEYARSVSMGVSTSSPQDTSSHSPHWYLSSRLLSSNTRSSPFPFSDLVVKNNDNFESLILTDDERYRTMLSAKAAHAYRPLLLEKKNWKYQRFFSRNYWMNRKDTDSEQIFF